MPKTLICLILLALLTALLSVGAVAQDVFGPFDRVAVVQNFLDQIYPDLRPIHGLILSRSEGFHLTDPPKYSSSPLQLDIVPCRPGSGIPGEGREPQRPRVPHCTGLFPQGFSDFLTLSVNYSDKFPISLFRARGSFVDGKSQAAKREIWDHPEWGRPEWTEAVLRANPRFGPAQKQEFIQSIPEQTLKAIREFTGCHLDLDTARFWVNRLGHKPDNMNVEIQWMIQGHESSKDAAANSCGASFEPFEAKLLTVYVQ